MFNTFKNVEKNDNFAIQCKEIKQKFNQNLTKKNFKHLKSNNIVSKNQFGKIPTSQSALFLSNQPFLRANLQQISQAKNFQAAFQSNQFLNKIAQIPQSSVIFTQFEKLKDIKIPTSLKYLFLTTAAMSAAPIFAAEANVDFNKDPLLSNFVEPINKTFKKFQKTDKAGKSVIVKEDLQNAIKDLMMDNFQFDINVVYPRLQLHNLINELNEIKNDLQLEEFKVLFKQIFDRMLDEFKSTFFISSKKERIDKEFFLQIFRKSYIITKCDFIYVGYGEDVDELNSNIKNYNLKQWANFDPKNKGSISFEDFVKAPIRMILWALQESSYEKESVINYNNFVSKLTNYKKIKIDQKAFSDLINEMNEEIFYIKYDFSLRGYQIAVFDNFDKYLNIPEGIEKQAYFQKIYFDELYFRKREIFSKIMEQWQINLQRDVTTKEVLERMLIRLLPQYFNIKYEYYKDKVERVLALYYKNDEINQNEICQIAKDIFGEVYQSQYSIMEKFLERNFKGEHLTMYKSTLMPYLYNIKTEHFFEAYFKVQFKFTDPVPKI